jgi:hypothetical protein
MEGCYLSDGKRGYPDGLLYGIDADVPVPAHVGMEDSGEEPDLWRMEGVAEGNLQVEEKVAALVRTSHRAAYRGLAMGSVLDFKFCQYGGGIRILIYAELVLC